MLVRYPANQSIPYDYNHYDARSIIVFIELATEAYPINIFLKIYSLFVS
jgi:hypothetical protein